MKNILILKIEYLYTVILYLSKIQTHLENALYGMMAMVNLEMR